VRRGTGALQLESELEAMALRPAHRGPWRSVLGRRGGWPQIKAAASSNAPPGALHPANRILATAWASDNSRRGGRRLADPSIRPRPANCGSGCRPDAYLFVLFHHLPDAGEARCRPRLLCRCGKDRGPGAEKRFENARRGTRVDPRLGRILRMHRRALRGSNPRLYRCIIPRPGPAVADRS